MRTTKIEWTETTWNPTTGCNKISAGCKYCYAERMTNRLQAMGVQKYQNGFELCFHPETLKEPYTWRKPRNVFVNSMSDLFHEEMPLDVIKKIFKVMNDNPIHTFQVLTKRADILLKYSNHVNWSKNIWMGVTIENQENISRLEYLKKVDANVRFLSIEPLIGKIEALNLENIDWVIVGGESGPNARPMKEEWVIDIKKQCKNQETPFFFKQWGGKNKKKNGRILEGQTWDEMPENIEVTMN
jgi:protein gp37